MNKPNWHNSALLAVACNTIMLQVCDDLKHTTLYTKDRKQRINALTKDLEGFMTTFYKNISEEEEQQYYQLVKCVERVATMLASLTPQRIDQFLALVQAWESGDIYEAATDKQLENMINQKKVKPLQLETSVKGDVVV